MSDTQQLGSVKPTSLSISSLLNNPHAINTNGARPSSRDIPLVHLTPIPVASINDFAAYNANIGVEFQNYIQAKQHGLQQHLQLNQSSVKPRASSIFSGSGGIDSVLGRQIAPSFQASSNRSIDETSSLFSGRNDSPRSESGDPFEDVMDQSLIPDIFGADDFDLKNPRTFDLVSGNAHIVAPLDEMSEGRHSIDTSSRLQEQFSAYLDTIETTLVDNISATGPAFFEAIGDLRLLQTRATQARESIKNVKQKLEKMRANSADVRLDLGTQSRKVQNVRKLREDLVSIRHLWGTYREIQEAAAEQDTLLSVRLMSDFERYLEATPGLKITKVVEQMEYGINKTKFTLGQADIAAFKSVLLDDVSSTIDLTDLDQYYALLRHRHLRSPRQSGDHSQAAFTELNVEKLRTELMKSIGALVLTDQLQTAYSEYSDAAVKASKLLTKRNLPSNEEEDDAQSIMSGKANRAIIDKSNALAISLRSLNGPAQNSMLCKIYVQTCIFVRRISLHQKVLIDLITSSSDSIPQSAQNHIYASQLATNIVDISQNRIVKLLNVRIHANLELSVSDLKDLYDLSHVFNRECEALTGQFGATLSNSICSQIRAHHAQWAELRSQFLTKIMETDSWQPVTTSEELQRVVNTLNESGTICPEEWQAPLKSYTLSLQEFIGSNKHVNLQATRFVLPESAIALLNVLEQSLSFGEIFQVVKSEAVGSVLGILRTFNSRSCQLILGAGATRSAGLERITAKHLAIASQAVSFVLVLIPSVQTYCSRFTGLQPAIIQEFSNIEMLYRDHRKEIHDKLVSIMEDRTYQICQEMNQSMVSMSGSNETGDPREPSVYMSSLVKDTLVLNRVLTKFLEAGSLQAVLDRVIKIEEKLLQAESEKFTSNARAIQQVSLDKAHFIDKLSSVSEQVGQILKPSDKKEWMVTGVKSV